MHTATAHAPGADGAWRWDEQFVFDVRTLDMLQCAARGEGTASDEDIGCTGVPRLRLTLMADNMIDSVGANCAM